MAAFRFCVVVFMGCKSGKDESVELELPDAIPATPGEVVRAFFELPDDYFESGVEVFDADDDDLNGSVREDVVS